MKVYSKLIKRFLDVFGSCLVLLLFAPFMIVIAVIVKLSIGSPVIFKQRRPGLRGQGFFIYKFRTMTEERDKSGELLSDTKRINPLGRFLRKLSIDELPELFNVIKGEMSLVGPRPLLEEYLSCYTPEQARRHEVKPGITGWAQIHGRNNTLFSKRFAMDVWYVDNCSFWLDMKIIILTVVKIFKMEGVRVDLDKCYYEANDCGLPSDLAKFDKN